jgi:hypothetical protein
MKSSIIQRIKNPVVITLIFLSILFLTSDYQFKWKNDQWKTTIYSDAAQYYRYLPMVFINHKLDSKSDNPTVIKYYVGTSIFYLPFFSLAYLSSMIFHYPIDGYSFFFQIFISIGTLFYLIFGLYYFSKFLKFYNFKNWIICTILIALSLSTIAYYTVLSPGWSHVVAFALISLLLYHFNKIYKNFNKKSLFTIITVLSFLFFVRPSDIIIMILIPFFATTWSEFIELIKKSLKERVTVLIALTISTIPLICQLAIYKVYSGEFIIWSYKGEGFNFLHPELFNVLFSYSKGLFVYTPICLLSLFGLLILYKRSRYQFYGVLLYLILNVYVISSWWCWNYGCSFGTRAFIEHYPIFFLLLALLLSYNKTGIRLITITLIILFSALNIFQMYQANQGFLDLDFKTDAKGFWSVFLRTDKGYSGKYYRYQIDETSNNTLKHITYFNDLESVDTNWINSEIRTSDKSHSGLYSSRVNNKANYSIGIRKKMELIPYTRNSIIGVSGWFNISKKGSDSFFALSFANNGVSFCFNTFNMDLYMETFGKWEYKVFEIYMPKFTETVEKQKDNVFECYLFNNSNIDCYVDDLKIEFLEFKKMERILDNSWDL